MSFIKTLNIKSGDCCPELGLASAPGDMTVDITYRVDSVELVSDEMASARYKTFSNDLQTGLGRFEFIRQDGQDLFIVAENELLKKLTRDEAAKAE